MLLNDLYLVSVLIIAWKHVAKLVMNMMVVRGPSKKVENKCISSKQENALEQDSRSLWRVVGTPYVLGNLMQGAPVSDSCCSLPHHTCRHMTFSADDHVSWKA